jgi:hypothetical protein
MEYSRANLLRQKKLTRDRIVPIISTSVSWLTFAITGSGLSTPKLVRPSGRDAEVAGAAGS